MSDHRDYTLSKYRQLLDSLNGSAYCFQTFRSFLEQPSESSIILRHDVDLRPSYSLEFAKIQFEYNIKGTYYFRAVPQSWDEKVIKSIADLGHEIGYHYECLTTTNGNLEEGIRDFKMNLNALRKLAPVETICMHGSPMSKYDSKDLWRQYKYQDFGIIGEPYFDIDFKKVYYLTDTGRKWDGHKSSVRDKVDSGFDLSYHTTSEVITAVDKGELPQQIMFTFHPQRWSDKFLPWTKELILQRTKNLVKRYLYVKS